MKKLTNKDELQALRQQAQQEIAERNQNINRIIVGMGTCGIAAGAQDVVNEILKELQRRHITNVEVVRTGCIGMCEREVLIDVVRAGEDRVTYGQVVPRDIPRIIGEHIVNGRIVEDMVVGRLTAV
ncbi:(2Fe-2S) ferredoxin domain-containing protein [Dethiobacter alkaliphilus]|uniref:(2Fe-2S) ferredoxin domain-containing protein n=1 Tax=Dethiobacter alkaliphilus TaxID=427926 RepID=UPI0022273BD8|nr:(2Fe-2S) ferredoxin domain-containing protein [Dethiobacter alkaliphilus]MCW3490135.1 (2Fe-2S) ferredoxin domain-containing protein [Dethiobacter alkaliphilus]